MSDFRQCSRDFLIEFIYLYRENDCLWRIKSKDYTNKDLKLKCYEKLRVKLMEVDEKATIQSVKNKINSLRSTFRAELKKIYNSKKSGAGEDEIYEPTLWYFKDLLFLKDQETPRSGMSSRESGSRGLQQLNTEDSAFASSPPSVPSEYEEETPVIRKRKANSNIQQAQVVLKQVAEKLNATKEDECDIYGKNIACDLRSLENEDRIYVKKIINDVIFEAKLGRSKQIRLLLEVEQEDEAIPQQTNYNDQTANQNYLC